MVRKQYEINRLQKREQEAYLAKGQSQQEHANII